MVTAIGVGVNPVGGAPVRPLNLDQVLPVFRNVLSNFDMLKALKPVVDCLDSGPFVNVSLISLKSLPYIYYGDNVLVKQFENGVSCRLRYGESFWTSTAAIIYNFVFAVMFSALSLVSLGQIKLFVDQMQKNWIHTALAVAAAGISFVGMVSPEYGIKANAAVGFATGVVLMQWMQGNLISKVCDAYQNNHQQLKRATADACADNGIAFNEFTPFFNYLDANLTVRVKTFNELTGVVQQAARLLPANVQPTASLSVITSNVQQLAFQLRNGIPIPESST